MLGLNGSGVFVFVEGHLGGSSCVMSGFCQTSPKVLSEYHFGEKEHSQNDKIRVPGGHSLILGRFTVLRYTFLFETPEGFA